MEITHLGHASFKVKGKKATVVTDPFDPDVVGMKFPVTSADIVTISHQHQDHNFPQGVEGNPLVIVGPGEYEVKGIKIVGLATYHDASSGSERGTNTIYRIRIDDISILHCGDIGHKFSDDQLEAIDDVDILLVPTGGHFTIDASGAAEIVSQIEPKIVIPMHYNYPKLNQSHFGELSPAADFLKQIGQGRIQPVGKLTISRDKLPSETTVVVLE